MKKINWKLIWNVVNGSAVLWLVLVAILYLAACICDGFVDVAKTARIEDEILFVTIVSLWIALIKPIGDAVINQMLRAREIIEEKYTEKKKAVKKTTR